MADGIFPIFDGLQTETTGPKTNGSGNGHAANGTANGHQVNGVEKTNGVNGATH